MRGIASLWVLGVLACAPSALGQAPGYEALVAEGIAEFGQGHWVEARSLFERAHALNPNARTLRGLGMVEFELRHYVQSSRLLSAALIDTREPLSRELRAKTRALADRTRGFIGRYSVELSPPSGTLTVDGAVATLDPDGVLWLDAGEHELAATATGHESHRRSLDVRGGADEPLPIVLRAVPVASVAFAAQTAPAASPRASAPLGPTAAVAGAEAGNAAPVDDDGLLTRWWFWTLTGAVVAVAVVGVVVASGEDEPGTAKVPANGVLVMALEAP